MRKIAFKNKILTGGFALLMSALLLSMEVQASQHTSKAEYVDNVLCPLALPNEVIIFCNWQNGNLNYMVEGKSKGNAVGGTLSPVWEWNSDWDADIPEGEVFKGWKISSAGASEWTLGCSWNGFFKHYKDLTLTAVFEAKAPDPGVDDPATVPDTGDSTDNSVTTNNGGSSDSDNKFNWNHVMSVTADQLREAASQEDMTNGTQNTVLDLVTGSDTEVPADMLESIKGRPVVLAFHTGNKLSFSVNGMDLSGAAGMNTPLNLIVRQGDSLIPAAVAASEMKDVIGSRQFEMDYKGSFGLTVNVHIELGKGNTGKYANVYRYISEAGKLEYLDSRKIVENGQAMFGMTQGAGYLVTITDKKGKETVSDSVYTVKSGDTLNAIAKEYKVNIGYIIALNPQVIDINKIQIGQKITLR